VGSRRHGGGGSPDGTVGVSILPDVVESARAVSLTPVSPYDPFERGRFPVGVRTIQGRDAARERIFTCEVWYPAADSHAGQDLAVATQDAFAVPGFPAPRRQ